MESTVDHIIVCVLDRVESIYVQAGYVATVLIVA